MLRSFWQFRRWVYVTLVGVGTLGGVAQQVRGERLAFEFRGRESAKFDLLDLRGDGGMGVVTDRSVPDGYGSNVLEVRGKCVLLLAKTKPVAGGTIVALWKDVDPRNLDADGVVLFAAKYGADISVAHNVKKSEPHMWLEQDVDLGVHFARVGEDGRETTLASKPGVGLTDGKWNKVGWFWQKVTFDGQEARGKFWSFVDPEPAEYQITTTIPGNSMGRVGLRGYSGHFRVAYFASSNGDIAIDQPPVYAYVTATTVLDGQDVDLEVFARPDIVSRTAGYTVVAESGKTRHQIRGSRNPFDDKGRCVLPICGSQADDDNGQVGPLTQSLAGGVWRLTVALLDRSGNTVVTTQRTLEVRPADAVKRRIARIERAIADGHEQAAVRKAKGQEYAEILLAVMTAQRFRDLADRRIKAGRVEEMERAVKYAEDALKTLDAQDIESPRERQ